MGEEVSVWYDEEGDYLEVLFARKKGYFRETDHDAVMEKVDEAGNILGLPYPITGGAKGVCPSGARRGRAVGHERSG